MMMGRMLIENAHDVKLLGRGIIDPSVKWVSVSPILGMYR